MPVLNTRILSTHPSLGPLPGCLPGTPLWLTPSISCFCCCCYDGIPNRNKLRRGRFSVVQKRVRHRDREGIVELLAVGSVQPGTATSLSGKESLIWNWGRVICHKVKFHKETHFLHPGHLLMVPQSPQTVLLARDQLFQHRSLWDSLHSNQNIPSQCGGTFR